MYRRPKFLEILLEIRRQMAHEADYDVDLFVETARSGMQPPIGKVPVSAPEHTPEATDEAVIPQLSRSREL